MAYFVDNKLIEPTAGIVIPGSGIDAKRFAKLNFSDTDRKQIREQLALRDDRITCVCIAKLEARKGIPEYIQAAKICAERNLPVDFVLVGPLVRETADLNYKILNNSIGVRYIGERDDIEQVLAATDIMILPTHYPEGIPRVLTEAASMGLALIASDQPGCRAVIDHGLNGFLLKSATAEQVANHVQRFVEEPELLRSAGKQSLTKSLQFSLTSIAQKVNATYKRTVAS